MSSRKISTIRKRAVPLFILFLIAYAVVIGRLAYIQFIRNDEYREWATKIRFRDNAIRASRGSIYDRNGRPLAISIEAASIYVNRREVSDTATTSYQVASLIAGDAERIQAEIEGHKTIAWIAKKVHPSLGDAVSKGYPVLKNGKQCHLRLPGVGVAKDTKRVYPAGSVGANILGFVDFENKGLEGAESVLDGVLTGMDGLERVELDARRRVIPETRRRVRQPENGRDVFLTIDTNIQHVAEQALARMADKYHPTSACAVVMDPNTGEVLALANYPSFDPNNPRAKPSSNWRNRAVADLYEPGSTLKVVTVAAGLNEGLNPHVPVVYCKGRERIRGGGIPCSLHHPFENGHGAADMYRIIEASCNIGAAHIAMRLGAEKLRGYEKAFGLLERPNAGFGCESVGYLTPAKDWPLIQLADIGFGQGIAVSPLQMACVYSTIANGGTYVQPRVIREIKNSDGTVCRAFKPKPLRRVISKAAAEELTRMMVGCVEDGTGKTAQIDGRTVAGKTGSAQMAKANGRGYESGAFVASFMGFAPAYKPRLTIAVVVTKPQGSHWGATVAAPVFQEIGEKALWYLRVPADAPTKQEEKRKPRTDVKRLA